MERLKIAGNRFLKGFIAGFIATMTTLMTALSQQGDINILTMEVWLKSAFLSCVIAGINGGLLALQKYLSFVE